MLPMSSKATSQSDSQSELSSDDSRKLRRTKGSEYQGKKDISTRVKSLQSFESLISSKTASAEASEEPKKGSKIGLRGRLKKSGSDTQFPAEAVYSSLKTYDKKVVQDQTEKDFWEAQFAELIKNTAGHVVVSELSKLRRLDVLKVLKKLTVKPEKLIVAVLKQFLLLHTPINGEVIEKLIQERDKLDNTMHSIYDAAIYNLLTPDQSAPYFQQIRDTPHPSNSSEAKLTPLERTYIQSTDPIKLLVQYRKGARDDAEGLKLTMSVAQAGNPDIFIQYISEVFSLLLTTGKDFKEVREGVKEFLREIRPIYLGDGAKIYAILTKLNDNLQKLVGGDKQQSANPIGRFIHTVIYGDGHLSLVDCLLKDIIAHVKTGEDSFDSLVAEHFAIEKYFSTGNLKSDTRIIKSLDQQIIFSFEPEQIYEYASKVFESKPKELFTTPWLVDFVTLLEGEEKLLPVVEIAIRAEVSDPATAEAKSESPLRGNKFSVLLIAEALRSSTRIFSTLLFQHMLETFGTTESQALKFWFNENNIRQSGRLDLLDPQRLAENEKRFFNHAGVVIGTLLSNMEISHSTVQILSLLRKHFKLRKNEKYTPAETWGVLSNTWILRGVAAYLNSLIDSLPSRFENRLEDPNLGVMKQFINLVLLKITVPDHYSHLPEGNPSKNTHLIYHKQIVKYFKAAVRSADQ